MTTTTSPATRDPADLALLFDAIAKADSGDTVALVTLRAMLRNTPEIAETVSNLAYNAESAILANVPAGAAELFRQQTTTLRQRLRREGTGSELESMLIRRIALDYLASLQAERQRAISPGDTRSLDLAQFYDQQANRAHRRFLASVESLARIRKLITPIQINIAEQQVNVAGSRSGARVPGTS